MSLPDTIDVNLPPEDDIIDVPSQELPHPDEPIVSIARPQPPASLQGDLPGGFYTKYYNCQTKADRSYSDYLDYMYQHILHCTKPCGHIDLLRNLSLRGFINQYHRRRLWPMLLGVIASDIDPYYSDYIDETHSSYTQLNKDILRSFTHLDIHTDNDPHTVHYHRQMCGRILHSLFSKHPQLSYCQGFHDVVVICLSITGVENDALAFALVEKIALTFMHENLYPTLQHVIGMMSHIPSILYAFVPRFTEMIVHAPLVYSLSWFLTWFSHTTVKIDTISRVFDFLLSSQPLMCIHLSSAVLLSHTNLIQPQLYPYRLLSLQHRNDQEPSSNSNMNGNHADVYDDMGISLQDLDEEQIVELNVVQIINYFQNCEPISNIDYIITLAASLWSISSKLSIIHHSVLSRSSIDDSMLLFAASYRKYQQQMKQQYDEMSRKQNRVINPIDLSISGLFRLPKMLYLWYTREKSIDLQALHLSLHQTTQLIGLGEKVDDIVQLCCDLDSYQHHITSSSSSSTASSQLDSNKISSKSLNLQIESSISHNSPLLVTNSSIFYLLRPDEIATIMAGGTPLEGSNHEQQQQSDARRVTPSQHQQQQQHDGDSSNTVLDRLSVELWGRDGLPHTYPGTNNIRVPGEYYNPLDAQQYSMQIPLTWKQYTPKQNLYKDLIDESRQRIAKITADREITMNQESNSMIKKIDDDDHIAVGPMMDTTPATTTTTTVDSLSNEVVQSGDQLELSPSSVPTESLDGAETPSTTLQDIRPPTPANNTVISSAIVEDTTHPSPSVNDDDQQTEVGQIDANSNIPVDLSVIKKKRENQKQKLQLRQAIEETADYAIGYLSAAFIPTTIRDRYEKRQQIVQEQDYRRLKLHKETRKRIRKFKFDPNNPRQPRLPKLTPEGIDYRRRLHEEQVSTRLKRLREQLLQNRKSSSGVQQLDPLDAPMVSIAAAAPEKPAIELPFLQQSQQERLKEEQRQMIQSEYASIREYRKKVLSSKLPAPLDAALPMTDEERQERHAKSVALRREKEARKLAERAKINEYSKLSLIPTRNGPPPTTYGITHPAEGVIDPISQKPKEKMEIVVIDNDEHLFFPWISQYFTHIHRISHHHTCHCLHHYDMITTRQSFQKYSTGLLFQLLGYLPIAASKCLFYKWTSSVFPTHHTYYQYWDVLYQTMIVDIYTLANSRCLALRRPNTSSFLWTPTSAHQMLLSEYNVMSIMMNQSDITTFGDDQQASSGAPDKKRRSKKKDQKPTGDSGSKSTSAHGTTKESNSGLVFVTYPDVICHCDEDFNKDSSNSNLGDHQLQQQQQHDASCSHHIQRQILKEMQLEHYNYEYDDYDDLFTPSNQQFNNIDYALEKYHQQQLLLTKQSPLTAYFESKQKEGGETPAAAAASSSTKKSTSKGSTHNKQKDLQHPSVLVGLRDTNQITFENNLLPMCVCETLAMKDYFILPTLDPYQVAPDEQPHKVTSSRALLDAWTALLPTTASFTIAIAAVIAGVWLFKK